MTISSYSIQSLSELTDPHSTDDLNERFQALQKNIEFVAAIMQTARVGSSLLGFNAAIDPTLEVGQPVYFNAGTNRFEAAKLELLEVQSILYASERADVWALVLKKCAVDKAHLLIDGIASIDMTAATGSANILGKWYLSRETGELTNNRDAILHAPVLLGTGDGQVLFRPWFADNFARYAPKTIPIAHTAAGTLVNSTAITTITNFNIVTPGWLPAAHAVFSSLTKPAGARFGYHYMIDSNLNDLWPPLLSQESRILIDSGTVESRGYTILLGSETNRLIINDTGIWWMTDRTGQCPWDMPFEITPPNTPPVGPLAYARRMYFEGAFTAVQPSSLQTVHSVVSRVPWLKIVDALSGQAASRGDLAIELLPSSWIVTNPVDFTGLAIKQLNDDKQFTQGPCVTTLISGSPSIVIAGGTNYAGYGRAGVLTISAQASKDFDLNPINIILRSGATNEEYLDTIGIGLPPNIDSNFVLEYSIPHTVPSSSSLRFVLWLLAPNQLAIPAGLTARVRILPNNVGTPIALPNYANLTIVYTSGAFLSANHYVAVYTENVVVAGGQTVYLEIARSGTTDNVGGRLDIIKVSGQFQV